MNLKTFTTLFAILFFFSTFAQGTDSITVTSNISLSAFPGEYAQTVVQVANNLADPVMVFVANAKGDLEESLALDNLRIEVEGLGEEELLIRGYVFHEAQPGLYPGIITLTTGNFSKEISVLLIVKDSWDELNLTIRVYPFSEKVLPGESLQVQVDVENLAKRETNLSLLVQFIDPDSKLVVVEVKTNFTVTTQQSLVEALNPPKKIDKKKYLVKSSVYSPEDGGYLAELASDSFEISLGVSPLTSASLLLEKVFILSNFQIFFGVMPAILLLILGYWRYKIIQERKRRYLGMVSFDYLPKPGKRSGFVGRVAESSQDAYMELDVLQTHTLCAGATGSGKTIAAQVILEEALLKNTAVIVFDPTGQWTGFLKPCVSRGMLRLYHAFNMKKSDSRAFPGNIHTIESPDERVDVRRYMNPGEITIFTLHKLDPKEIDVFIDHTIRDVFTSNLPESSECKLILVYDEVHRLLPKFGGSGNAFVQVERAVREFRKWGVGLVLISQILSDFVGEIKANIGTELQMRTRYEKDLERISLKYGVEAMRSVIKANVGTGMVQNAEYNQGRPYFISFRPILHDSHRLSDDLLDLFGKYNKKLEGLSVRSERLAEAGVDVFDLNIEINLALENVRKVSFDVAGLYIQGISERINGLEKKLADKKLPDATKALVSNWEEDGVREVEGYKKLIEEEAKNRRDSLLTIEGEVKAAMSFEIKKLESQRVQIKKKLQTKIKPREKEKLLKEHEKVVLKEKALEEKLLEDLEGLVREITRTEGMLWRITSDRRLIETQSGRLSNKEYELRQRIERDVASIVDEIIDKKREVVTSEERASLIVKASNTFKKYLMKKAWEAKQVERKMQEESLVRELTERKGRIYSRGRKGRKDIIGRKDNLLAELKSAKGKWAKILENEKNIRAKESMISEKRDKLRKVIAHERASMALEQKRINEERKKIMESLSRKVMVPGVTISDREELVKEIESKEVKIDRDFKHLEGEWKKMDKCLEEAKKLDEELNTLREQWGSQEDLRMQEEEEIMTKRDELLSIKKDVKDMLEDGGLDD